MRRPRTNCLGFLLLSMPTVFAAYTAVENCQWVDVAGKVHLGEKPKDPAQGKPD